MKTQSIHRIEFVPEGTAEGCEVLGASIPALNGFYLKTGTDGTGRGIFIKPAVDGLRGEIRWVATGAGRWEIQLHHAADGLLATIYDDDFFKGASSPWAVEFWMAGAGTFPDYLPSGFLTLIPAHAGAVRLLSPGDLMDEEPTIGSEQEETSTAAISAFWGSALATGGVKRQLAWSRQLRHASPAAARVYCLSHAAELPYNRQGKLRIALQAGGAEWLVWDIERASVTSDSPKIERSIPHATTTTYRARGGRTRPVTKIFPYAGITPAWVGYIPRSMSSTLPSSL